MTSVECSVMGTWVPIFLFLFMFENSNNKKLKIIVSVTLLDWCIQKITEEYILHMDWTAGDRTDWQHILHRNSHLHVYSKKMVQLTIVEAEIQEIWNSTKGHIFKQLIIIRVCLSIADLEREHYDLPLEKTAIGADYFTLTTAHHLSVFAPFALLLGQKSFHN